MIKSNFIGKGIIDQFQASEILGLPVQDIIYAILNDNLPARKIGDVYFIRNSALKDWLNKASSCIPSQDQVRK